jgi:hypothetical protein
LKGEYLGVRGHEIHSASDILVCTTCNEFKCELVARGGNPVCSPSESEKNVHSRLCQYLTGNLSKNSWEIKTEIDVEGKLTRSIHSAAACAGFCIRTDRVVPFVSCIAVGETGCSMRPSGQGSELVHLQSTI